MPQRDHYDVLGVCHDATSEEIKAVYRQLARTFHPDVNADPEAVEHFREITEAFLVLSDPEQRAAYDRKRPLARRPRRARGESEREVHIGLRVAGINLGGLLGVSVNVTQRPLIDDGADEDSR